MGYTYWHLVRNINPIAKALVHSKLKEGSLLGVSKELSPIEYIKDDKTDNKIKFHDTLFIGKTDKSLSKKETAKEIKKLLKEALTELKENAKKV